MSRIKLTRRSLLIISVVSIVVFIIVLVGGYILTPQWMASSIQKQEQAGNQGAALILRERLIEFFPSSEEARWEIFALADRLLQAQDRIIIGPDFTSGGGSRGAGQVIPVAGEEIVQLLEQVAEKQKEAIWRYNSLQKLAEVYRTEGHYQQAEDAFLLAAQGFESEKMDFRVAEVNGNLVDMYLQAGDTAKALTLIEGSLEKYPKHRQGDFLAQKGDAYFLLEDFSQAEESYKKAQNQAEAEWKNIQRDSNDKEANIYATLQEQPLYTHSKSRLEQITALKAEGPVEPGKIQGEIYAGSVPMPNVLVYLLSEKEHDGRMNNLEGVASQPPVKTDAHGKFQFNGVTPGKYFTVLGVMPDDLEGLGRFKGLEAFTVESSQAKELKYVFEPRLRILGPVGQQTFKPGKELKITWEEVPQASSYNLHISLKLKNGYVSRVYLEDIRESFYLFNPQGLSLRDMNFAAWSDGVLSPSAILGSFYPGAEIYLVVEALDELGRSISDSEGYVLDPGGNYPSIIVAEQENTVLSPGDKLVTELKYPEAVQAYQKELGSNPGDPLALLSLARLYNYHLSDPLKAMEYYKKLLEISRERFVLEEAASTAVRVDDNQLAIELFQEIEEDLEEDSFWFHLMGELYFQSGQAEKALSYYMKHLDDQKEFVNLGPVMAMLYQDDVDGALKLLQTKDYSQRLRYDPQGGTEKPAEIKVLLLNLESYSRGTPSAISKEDFRKYLLELIRIDDSNRLAKVKAFRKEIAVLGENDVLVRILSELARDRL